MACGSTAACSRKAAGCRRTECAGLAVIDTARIDEINLLDEALTVATVPAFEAVAPRRMVATVKVIPFAAPEAVVRAAADIARAGGPLVRVAPFKAMAVGLVLTRLPGTKETVLDNTVKTVRARLAAIGSELAGESRIDHGEDAIAAAVRAELAAGRAEVEGRLHGLDRDWRLGPDDGHGA